MCPSPQEEADSSNYGILKQFLALRARIQILIPFAGNKLTFGDQTVPKQIYDSQ